MATLLYVESSPRGVESASTQAADLYLNALPSSISVERLPLFDMNLPEFDGATAAAKYKVLSGQQPEGDEAAAWSVVTEFVGQFKAADHYLITAPMWNFGIPYKLKQYIDLITHPGMTFTAGANGIKGLAGGSGVVIYARGGNYSPKEGKPDPFDHQSPYLRAWLGLVGVDPVAEIAVQQTMGGPEALADALGAAKPELEQLAGSLS